MKKLNILKRKLTKSELKEINGGTSPACFRGFCMVPGSDDLFRGFVGQDGFCC
ncbi:hypothetical protein [Chryseobacterium phosphatilyticum]|uniref:hypothetical protein n=1 Tax=Chryseobacterium phosphatilyticum TaxID=475075 RepID=UPI0014034544|nr:hypothetical protein [Chryseobacterium phosphatilyticum]